MKTTVLMNLKGGVAKTATVINMACILASEHKERVLVIDADSQGDTTAFFGVDGDDASLCELLTGLEPYCEQLIQSTSYANLDILPASDRLMDLDLSKVESQEVHAAAIHDLAINVAEDDAYDRIIIDCPPAFSAATVAALLAADEVIIPIKLDAFSLRGMANLMRQVQNMRKVNPKLRVAGCLVTMWYRDEKMQQAEDQLRASALPVFQRTIRRSDKVNDMTFAQQPLSVYSPRSSAGVDYRRFVREYLRMSGKAAQEGGGADESEA